MTERSPKPWFAAKRYGYGAGLPISWEGWLAFGAYLVFLPVCVMMTPFWIHIPLILAATILFGILAKRRTKGGWRWRKGG